MEFAPADLSAIPVRQLVPRRLRLGPFASGRDLVKFLCFATIGAAAAAVTSALLWLPFLAAGAIIAFLRIEGQTLDDFALGYWRFRQRCSGSACRVSAAPGPRASRSRRRTNLSLRAGGIPIAYLPPADLQRLFDGWRSALSAIDGSIGVRTRAELFSPLPFLPTFESPPGEERAALESYRELVRALLRRRYRRVVDVTGGTDRSAAEQAPLPVQAQLDGLATALERLGIPVDRRPPDPAAIGMDGAAPS